MSFNAPANARFGKQELVPRLREYLSELSPESHRTLLRSIDRARARGEHSSVHSVILDALRGLLDDETGVERTASAERSFFHPLEPIMSGTPLPEKQVGIIDRSSLRPIWIWITRDLAPGRCDGPLAALRAAIVDEDVEAIEYCARDFQAAVIEHAEIVMAEHDKVDGSLRRIEGQLGSSRVLADLHDMIAFFKQRAAFDDFMARLPEKLPVGRAGLDLMELALAAYKDNKPSDTIYAFAAIVDKMGSPSDLVRFAVHHTQSSNPSTIRGSLAGSAVQIALSEAMKDVERLRLSLTGTRDLAHVTTILRKYHELVSTISRTLDEDNHDPWVKRISTIRGRASDLLSKELEPLLHMVRRVVSIVESRGREIVPDRSSVDEAIFGLTLLMAARETRGSLAINTLIERLEKGITDALESQGKQAIERLVGASDENWGAAVARSAAAVKLFGIYYGGAYGASMARRHTSTVESRAVSKAS